MKPVTFWCLAFVIGVSGALAAAHTAKRKGNKPWSAAVFWFVAYELVALAVYLILGAE
jgi:uncharacterized membrane protein YsdA (DUF1294 family)